MIETCFKNWHDQTNLSYLASLLYSNYAGTRDAYCNEIQYIKEQKIVHQQHHQCIAAYFLCKKL